MRANLLLGATILQAVLDDKRRETGVTTFLNSGTSLSAEISLYALSKHQFAAWGTTLAKQASQRLQFVNIRLQHIYGPGDDRSKFTSQIIEACQRNDPRIALTAGEQQRDFIYIDDVVTAYDVILSRRTEFSAADTIDVGTGKAIRVRDFVELVQRITTASTLLDFGALPYRPNEAMLCAADTTRLLGLGWRPRVTLELGITRTACNTSP